MRIVEIALRGRVMGLRASSSDVVKGSGEDTSPSAGRGR